jgi:hypothetical protein
MDDMETIKWLIAANYEKAVQVQKIQDFRAKLMDCKSQSEISSLVFQYDDLLNENPKLYTAIKLASVRVGRLHKEKLNSYNNLMN